MSMQLQPETEISSDRSGSAVYIGEWEEAMALVHLFNVQIVGANYSYIAFTPVVLLDATAVGTASTTPTNTTNWAAVGAAIKTAGTLLATGARVRAMPGGLAQLTISFGNPDDIQAQLQSAIKGASAKAEISYSFGVTETSRSVFDEETATVQANISAWMVGGYPQKGWFKYWNFSTEEYVALTETEREIAVKILHGADVYTKYQPTVTMTISKSPTDPTLPFVGPGATAPEGVHFRTSGTYSWRVISSGSAPCSDGTWSGAVTWEGTEIGE